MGYWGKRAHTKVCSDTPPLDLYLYMKKYNKRITSPVDMIHMEADEIVLPIHQRPLNGMEGPRKTCSCFVEE